MIVIVTEKKLIARYQKQFILQLKSACGKKMRCTLGYQGSSEDEEVYYSEEFNFWFSTHPNYNRYWNAFGYGEPSKERNNSITVEINPPYEGVNRNIGGVFGHDNNGDVLVLHRGKIGGGRVGIGKKLFFDNFRDEPILGIDDGIENEFCLIGSLGSKLLPRQVGNFVSEVHRIKSMTSEQVNDFSKLNNFSFTDEASGKSKVKRTGTTTIERTHGIVVNLLARLIEAKGHKVAKDRNRDLFIHKKGQVNKMFEIKTSSSTQDLYSAVGQLLIYSIPIKTQVDLILVIPEKLSKPVKTRLDELGIQILYYQWKNEEPVFENLNSYLE
jgi:hypothetical protein